MACSEMLLKIRARVCLRSMPMQGQRHASMCTDMQIDMYLDLFRHACRRVRRRVQGMRHHRGPYTSSQGSTHMPSPCLQSKLCTTSTGAVFPQGTAHTLRESFDQDDLHCPSALQKQALADQPVGHTAFTNKRVNKRRRSQKDEIEGENLRANLPEWLSKDSLGSCGSPPGFAHTSQIPVSANMALHPAVTLLHQQNTSVTEALFDKRSELRRKLEERLVAQAHITNCSQTLASPVPEGETDPSFRLGGDTHGLIWNANFRTWQRSD